MTTPVVVCGACNAIFMSTTPTEDRLAHMQVKHPDFLAKNRPTRIDIMIDGQKPLDMWTYEELSARRAELMEDMNNHSLRINVLQKQIAELTPHLNQTISHTPAHERKLPVVHPFSSPNEPSDGPTT